MPLRLTPAPPGCGASRQGGGGLGNVTGPGAPVDRRRRGRRIGLPGRAIELLLAVLQIVHARIQFSARLRQVLLHPFNFLLHSFHRREWILLITEALDSRSVSARSAIAPRSQLGERRV